MVSDKKVEAIAFLGRELCSQSSYICDALFIKNTFIMISLMYIFIREVKKVVSFI